MERAASSFAFCNPASVGLGCSMGGAVLPQLGQFKPGMYSFLVIARQRGAPRKQPVNQTLVHAAVSPSRTQDAGDVVCLVEG